MKPPEPIPLPPFAHVPGQGPRHAEGAFDALTAGVRAGMTVAELAETRAWAAGWRFLRAGYFWEAHEVLEPVWMALPEGSAERAFVQAAIQTANAALKRRMGRPRAVSRLCAMVRELLAQCAGRTEIMGRGVAELQDSVGRLEAGESPFGEI